MFHFNQYKSVKKQTHQPIELILYFSNTLYIFMEHLIKKQIKTPLKITKNMCLKKSSAKTNAYKPTLYADFTLKLCKFFRTLFFYPIFINKIFISNYVKNA